MADRSWTGTLRAIFSARMLVMLAQGFSSGLPLALTASSLQAWMATDHIDIKKIGLMGLVALPYGWKWVWSPLLDRFPLPFLGRRRGWLLVIQLALVAAIAGMSLFSPAQTPGAIAVMALLVAFASASQDIVIDAYRVDLLRKEEFAFGFAVFTNGYRIGMLLSGAVALGLSDHLPWRVVYLLMAGAMGVGVLTTLLAPEPPPTERPPKTFADTVIEPFLDFFRRRGSVETLLFVFIYKLDTNFTVALMTPFFLQVGFTGLEIATITKGFGLGALIVGGIVAGIVMTKWSLHRALVIFGIMQAVAGLSFMGVAHWGKSYVLLTAAIASENFFSGMGVAAQGAFMMSLVSRRFSVTQYALLTSFMGLSRTIVSAPAGYAVAYLGWEKYYLACVLLGIPGLLMLLRFPKWRLPENA